MIGVMTYNTLHRKTYDTLCLLKAKGIEEEVIVFAEPLHYSKQFKPLIAHRPSSHNLLTPKELCQNFGFTYLEGFDENRIPPDSKILICGAGIIPQEIICKYKLINAHPGYLPNVRGLDALKWAVYDGQPIGVTTHLLSEHVDAGLIIERNLVPLYFNDTFHAVAQRQYEMEINMLVGALEIIDAKMDSSTDFAEPHDYPVKKRMPHEMETRVMKRFESLIQKIAI